MSNEESKAPKTAMAESTPIVLVREQQNLEAEDNAEIERNETRSEQEGEDALKAPADLPTSAQAGDSALGNAAPCANATIDERPVHKPATAKQSAVVTGTGSPPRRRKKFFTRKTISILTVLTIVATCLYLRSAAMVYVTLPRQHSDTTFYILAQIGCALAANPDPAYFCVAYDSTNKNLAKQVRSHHFRRYVHDEIPSAMAMGGMQLDHCTSAQERMPIYERLTRKYPQNAQLSIWAAACAAEMGDRKLAVEYAEKSFISILQNGSLTRKDDTNNPHGILADAGDLLDLMGATDESAALEKYIPASQEDNADISLYRARRAFGLKNYSEAELLCLKALRGFHNNPIAGYTTWECSMDANNLLLSIWNAEKKFEPQRDVNFKDYYPSNSNDVLLESDKLASRGKLAEALAKLPKNDPKEGPVDPEVIKRKAALLIRTGAANSAVQLVNQTLASQPQWTTETARLRMIRAEALFQVRDFNGALKDCKYILGLNPKSQEALSLMQKLAQKGAR